MDLQLVFEFEDLMTMPNTPSKVRVVHAKASALVAADLFCGAGGLSFGFQNAGFQIAFANDINEEYANTYRLNHEGTKFFRESIEDLTTRDVFRKTGLGKTDIDILIGGPPCQGFSINAPKRSLEDDRNHLFREYGRLVLEGLRPKVIVMENVPGMVSLDGGRFIKDIYALFEGAGYRMRHMILCAAHYGIPQERWRLFFIGTILKNAEISFPEPTHYAPVRANFTGGRSMTWLPSIQNGVQRPNLFGMILKPFTTVQDAIGDLPALGIRQGTEEAEYSGVPATPYQRLMRAKSRLLFNHVAGSLSKQNLERLKHIKPGGSWREIPRELLPKGMKKARRSDHTRRYGRIDPDGLSGTVLTKCDPHWGSFFHYEQDRALTVREAARIQSFPDDYRFYGSRVSQYEQVGNAVPPLLAETLAKHIRSTLLNA
ncbi:MAG: DNA cytosine methyltransferase [Bryobacteraceae bacterium]